MVRVADSPVVSGAVVNSKGSGGISRRGTRFAPPAASAADGDPLSAVILEPPFARWAASHRHGCYAASDRGNEENPQPIMRTDRNDVGTGRGTWGDLRPCHRERR